MGPDGGPARRAFGVRKGPRRASHSCVNEARRLNPTEKITTGVGLGSVASRDLSIYVHPAIQTRVGRSPRESSVVAVSDGEDATGMHDTVHLAQRGDRLGQVLQDLVGMDHFKRRVAKWERVRITDRKRHVGCATTLPPRLGAGDPLAFRVTAENTSLCTT